MSAAIDETGQERCNALCAIGEKLGKAANLLQAAAITLHSDKSSEDVKLRRIAGALTNEARALLRDAAPDGIDGGGLANAIEIESDIFRLYSQVLILASTLASEKAVSGDEVCDYPEADALELAGEFAGADCGEGLYGRINKLAGDVLVAGTPSSKCGTEARP
jgi:hypothetical protein